MQQIPPPTTYDKNGPIATKTSRRSNLELYRIVCMLMIVAHHYVVNSGLTSPDGPLKLYEYAPNSIFLWLFGAWGKTGINCFLLITGYFMCKSRITVRKFLKLLLQIYFFRLVIYVALLFGGYETVSLQRTVKLMMPFWGIRDNFTGCFLVFYLTIPFWTILVQNMSKRQHQCLLLLMLGCYTLLGSIPSFHISFNYVTWFGVLFVIASYIRMYPAPVFERRQFWGGMTFISVVLSVMSIMLVQRSSEGNYYFVADSNKILAVSTAVCSFLWFKNMDIPQSKLINAIGGSTFGVLLIHANSDAMRTWLWKDTLDVVGHYTLPFGQLILFSVIVVLGVFVICNLIDQLRIATIEKAFFCWYDNKLAVKADRFVAKLTESKNQ